MNISSASGKKLPHELEFSIAEISISFATARRSIPVNAQSRITFRFEGGRADDVTCEDYH